MKVVNYLDCHTGAASAASPSAEFRHEVAVCHARGEGGVGRLAAQVGTSRSGAAGKLGPVQTRSWQQSPQ